MIATEVEDVIGKSHQTDSGLPRPTLAVSPVIGKYAQDVRVHTSRVVFANATLKLEHSVRSRRMNLSDLAVGTPESSSGDPRVI
jgi:hypothetical protein